jgi:hypothetical protein
MAAVMAVGSAMAAGAMAADLTATYADDTVTFSGVTAGKSQYTLLVVEGTKAADATEYTYDATEATIKQIDQNDAGVAFTEAVVGELADGSYKVLVGNNDGTIDSGIFTVSSAPAVEYEDIVIGDVNSDEKVNASDSAYILTYVKKRKADKVSTSATYTAETMDEKATADGKYYIGDVNADNKVNASDSAYVLTYVKKRKADKVSTSATYTANTMDKISIVK